MIRIGVRSFVSAGSGTDADAQAFITAAGITDATQQSAINTLVTDLKGYGIWTKMKAIYPFVGGTSSTHKWNLKDPRDLDAAFRLVFNGGWTHGSTGATPNGTNGYADSFLANNIMSQNSLHISIYSRTNFNTYTAGDVAAWNGTFGSVIYTRSSINKFNANNNSINQINQSNNSSLGFFVNTRTSSTQVILQVNSTQTTYANNSTNNIASSFKIARTGDFNGEYSPRQYAFASIGDGLTDTEASNLYTAVQAYQTTLSRNV